MAKDSRVFLLFSSSNNCIYRPIFLKKINKISKIHTIFINWLDRVSMKHLWNFTTSDTKIISFVQQKMFFFLGFFPTDLKGVLFHLFSIATADFNRRLDFIWNCRWTKPKKNKKIPLFSFAARCAVCSKYVILVQSCLIHN